MNILVIEDDDNDAMLIRRALRKASFPPVQIFRCATGIEGLDYLDGKRAFADRTRYPLPTLLFLDLYLPDMHGFQILKWIRANPQFKRLPVVILSESQAEADIEKAYSLLANSYLTKTPLLHSPEILERVLCYWTQSNQIPRTNR